MQAFATAFLQVTDVVAIWVINRARLQITKFAMFAL
jgi:hypothetical protein